VYATFDEKVPRNVPLPDHPVRNLFANPNYQKILAMLLRPGIQKPEKGIHQWVSREYLYNQLWPVYTPSRTKRVKPGEPQAIPAKNKRGTKPAAELSHGTLSTLLHSLEEAGLVLEETASDTKREKIYQITERGEIAFRFYASAATSTLVQTVLDKN
jgi:hypothetical protein